MIFKKQLEQEQTALVSNSLGETHTVLYNDKQHASDFIVYIRIPYCQCWKAEKMQK